MTIMLSIVFWVYINNESVFQSADAYAIKVRNDFNGLLMPAFENVLNEEQVMEIYKFLNKK